MYSTSEAYKRALLSRSLKNRVQGTITFENGETATFSDANIVPGSLSINNRATNSNQFSLGSVYVGELKVSLLTDIDRYSLKNAKVSVSYFLETEDGEEEIPMGVFYVSAAKRTKRVIDLTCYDRMTEFDTQILLSSDGTAYELLEYICGECKVELGTTQAEIESYVNGKTIFTMNNADIQSYRNAIAGIAALMGCFATIGRDDKLYIKQFSTTPSAVIPASSRVSSEISDYSTYFVGVKARFKAKENYYPYTALTGREEGLVLDLGDVPLLDGSPQFKQRVLDALGQYLNNIEYVPVDMQIISDPSIDLGDMLTISGANGTTDAVQTLVTFQDWKYRRSHSVAGEGIDPHLGGVKSATALMIATLESTTERQQLLYYNFTNSSKLTVTEEWLKIVDIDVLTMADTDLMAFITINLEAETNTPAQKFRQLYYDEETTGDEKVLNVRYEENLPAICEVKYNWKGNDLSFLPIETYQDGKHVLTLAYFLNDVEANTNDTFIAYMKCTNGVITIQKGQCIASIIAQGLVAKENEWDGQLSLSDNVDTISIAAAQISIEKITDRLATRFFPIARSNISDNIGIIHIDAENISVAEVNEILSVAIKEQIVAFMLNEYTEKVDGKIVLLDDAPGQQTLYSINYGVNGDIENATVESSDDILYGLSFDGGNTWKAYDGTEWKNLFEDGSGMDRNDFISIPLSEWRTQTVNNTFMVRATLFTSDSYIESVVINYVY